MDAVTGPSSAPTITPAGEDAALHDDASTSSSARTDLPDEETMRAVLAVCVHDMHVPVVVVNAVVEDMPMIYVNPAYAAVTGYRADDLLGRNGRMLQGPGTDPATVADIAAALAAGDPVQVRLLNYRPDTTTWWNEMHISPIRDHTGALTHWMGVSHDVTAAVSAETAALHAAARDDLTGLPGRAELRTAMATELTRSHDHGEAAAVLYCDVDDFKDVNDTHGHGAGDLVLAQTADRLRAHLRPRDVAARVGGDEFVVLLAGLPHGTAQQIADRRAAQLTTALSAPVPLPGSGSITPTVSIGVAVHPRSHAHDEDDDHGHQRKQQVPADVDALVAAADTAMYARKYAR